jgi:polysaccharide biosynthesis/export protein VpsN
MLRFFSLALLFVGAMASYGDESGYRLGAGDVIRVDVYDEPDLSFERILIGESGKFSFPFLGDIRVEGHSLSELESIILKGLKPDYLLDPKLSVSVVEYRPFFLSGEVKSPGSHPYQPGITLRQAISLAGGFTERASQSKIFVVHENAPNEERTKVDLNYRVRPGDTITVEQSFF